MPEDDPYKEGRENGERDTWIKVLQEDVAEIKADVKTLNRKVYWAYGAAAGIGALAAVIVTLLAG